MSIVKMKRLRLIGMQAERESLLRLLQHMGAMHAGRATPEKPVVPKDTPKEERAAKEA